LPFFLPLFLCLSLFCSLLLTLIAYRFYAYLCLSYLSTRMLNIPYLAGTFIQLIVKFHFADSFCPIQRATHYCCE
jgi:hypothetical protein